MKTTTRFYCLMLSAPLLSACNSITMIQMNEKEQLNCEYEAYAGVN